MLIGEEKITERVEKIIANINKDENELIEIDDVMVIVVVHYGSDLVEETETGSLFYSCSTGRYHVQRGLLEQAIRAVNYNQEPRKDD